MRPPASVWYLLDGALVTFYRRKGPFEIEVLRRYLSRPGEADIRPWTGTYDDILSQFWQRWDWLERDLVEANR